MIYLDLKNLFLDIDHLKCLFFDHDDIYFSGVIDGKNGFVIYNRHKNSMVKIIYQRSTPRELINVIHTVKDTYFVIREISSYKSYIYHIYLLEQNNQLKWIQKVSAYDFMPLEKGYALIKLRENESRVYLYSVEKDRLFLLKGCSCEGRLEEQWHFCRFPEPYLISCVNTDCLTDQILKYNEFGELSDSKSRLMAYDFKQVVSAINEDNDFKGVDLLSIKNHIGLRFLNCCEDRFHYLFYNFKTKQVAIYSVMLRESLMNSRIEYCFSMDDKNLKSQLRIQQDPLALFVRNQYDYHVYYPEEYKQYVEDPRAMITSEGIIFRHRNTYYLKKNSMELEKIALGERIFIHQDILLVY